MTEIQFSDEPRLTKSELGYILIALKHPPSKPDGLNLFVTAMGSPLRSRTSNCTRSAC